MDHSRRNFIRTAGCLTIGFCLGGQAFKYPSASPERLTGLMENPAIDAWLQVLANGSVRVLTGKMELGQGISIAVAQVAAEELNMEMAQVEVALAETGLTANEGYTAGSGSIKSSAMSIRYAAAAARQRLLELAAQKMKIPVAELRIGQGKISLGNGDRSTTFAELLEGKQLTDEIQLPVALKAKDSYRFVGKPIPREDIGRMVIGAPVYLQDLRFPGMVHARVLRPPAYGARLLPFDEKAIREKMPALLKTVVNGSFLAVIAAEEVQAIQALQLLRENTTWSDGPPLPKLSGDQLAAYLQTLPVQTQRVAEKGKPASRSGLRSSPGLTSSPGPTSLSANDAIKARYSKPYTMHGSIGPSCAVALYDKDRLDLWTHSQGVYPLQSTLAELLQLPAENIHVKGVPGSGCYGHNGADDAAADAALLAVAYPGKHVRLQWMREDEHAWEPYGSAMIMEVEASLEASGKISHWKYALWSDTHGTRPGGKAENLLPAQYLEKPFTGRPSGFSGGAYRNAEPYYTIPNRQVDAHFFHGPLRVSSLRSLGAYGNLFAIESFMDELATKAGIDPYEFRLLNLDDERAKEVIRQLRSLTKGQAAPQTGIGIAFSRYENTEAYCAVAARVAVNTKTGSIQVQKMWAAIDVGEAINPDGIKNQIEGSMIQSASWTIREEVKFDERQITSRHWGSYPIFRFNQVPEVEVVVLDRPAERSVGAGEAAQGPAAAAIANAVFQACGKRIRHLPLLSSLKH